MAGYIEDRWWTKRPDPETGKKRKTALYGKGKRYKVTGVPGVRARSFDAKADAVRWKAKAENESQQGEFVDPRLGRITLTDYIEEHWWPARHDDPATRRTIRSRLIHIESILGSTQVGTIKAQHLRLFLKELQNRVGPTTTHSVWGYLSAVLQAAVDDERIRKNPCKSKTITLPTVPEQKVRPWQRSQVRTVRAALPDRFQAMVDVGVGVGLRQGEVLGLAEDDIDMENEVIHVRRQLKKIGSKLVFAPPKRGKTRTVPAPPHLLDQVRGHMESFPPKKITLPWGNPDEPQSEKEAKERAPQTVALVFTTVRGCAIRRDSWNQWSWKPALAAAGVIPEPDMVSQGTQGRIVPRYSEAREDGFHVLRHTFASVQLHARETVVAVAKWLGHSDPSITLRVYTHMMPEADGRGRRAMQDWFEDDS